MDKKIAIIILNWRTYKQTVKCIQSVKRSSYKNFTIIVVDNDSGDGSLEKLTEEFTDIHFIKNNTNAGYAGGNNLGIRYALEHGFDYVWILNPDTMVMEDTLSILVRFVDSKEMIASPQIMYMEEPEKIWFVDSTLSPLTGIATHLHHGEMDQGQFKNIIDVPWIPGTALFVPRTVFEKVGLLDDGYFLFYEDVDFSVRVREKGMSVSVIPEAKVQHFVGAVAGRGNPRNEYYVTRNRLYFLKKHSASLWWPLCAIYLLVRTCFASLKSRIQQRATIIQDERMNGIIDFFKSRMGIKHVS